MHKSVAAPATAALGMPLIVLLAARFVQALGAAAGLVAPRAIVADLCDVAESSRIFSVLMQIMMIAPILAPIIGGYLLGWGSWRLIFWVMAALGVAGWLWGLRALPDSLPVAQRVPLRIGGILRAYARQMRDPVFMLYTLAGGFILGSLFVYISASAFVFTEHFKLDALQFSYLFAANSIALVLGGSISNLLLKRGGQTRHIMLLGTLVHGLFGLLLFAAVQSGWASLAVYVGLLAVAVGSLHYLSAAVVGYLVSLAAPGLATLSLAIALCGMLTLSTCLLAQRAALRAALR